MGTSANCLFKLARCSGSVSFRLIALMRASQSRAFLQERDYVKPDDVKAVAMQVLEHRLSLTSEARMRKESVSRILYSLILKGKIRTE